jgi:hypothetical protein
VGHIAESEENGLFMAKDMKSFIEPNEQEIARYAYYLWESEGRVAGRDLEYWLQAKAHLMANRKHEAGLLTAREMPEAKTVSKKAAVMSAIQSSSATSKPARRKKSGARSTAAEPMLYA